MYILYLCLLQLYPDIVDGLPLVLYGSKWYTSYLQGIQVVSVLHESPSEARNVAADSGARYTCVMMGIYSINFWYISVLFEWI